MEWLFIVFVAFAFVLWCCLRMADKSDEKIEEQHKEDTYRSLDPKSLDDDIMIDNSMEENIYEKENEEDIPKGRKTRSKSSK